MKEVYNISGLNCPHCASALEKELLLVKNVKSCSIDFESSKLYFEFEEKHSKSTIKNVMKILKKKNLSVSIIENVD